MAISRLTLDRFLAFANYDRDRTSLMPNAIHLGQFGLAPRNVELERRLDVDGRKVILTLGRMDSSERYKGFDAVLECLPSLARRVPNLTYLLAGDGDDRPRLERKAVDLGVADKTRFTGYIKEQEKADLFRLADAYVMPSYGEGFGFVFLEAMACGVPVIGSRTDGSREALLDGELGRLVDPHDLKEIEDAVVAALDEPKRIPARLEYFSYDAFRTRVCGMIHDLFDRSSNRRALVPQPGIVGKT